jgi:hypothetical protein
VLTGVTAEELVVIDGTMNIHDGSPVALPAAAAKPAS